MKEFFVYQREIPKILVPNGALDIVYIILYYIHQLETRLEDTIMRVLGLDLGGVVIDTPTRISLPYEVALEHIRRTLKDTPPTSPLAVVEQIARRFDHVWIVSACSDGEVKELTRMWLDHVDFWNITGLKRDQLHFCGFENGAKAQKVRTLNPLPTHFLDDRWEYLRAMEGVVLNRTFYDRGEGEPNPDGLPVVTSLEEYLAQL